jgi:hypothetical protein
MFSRTGLSPSTVCYPNTVPLTQHFLTPRRHGSIDQQIPQPHVRNPCQVSHVRGLAFSAFARHYSRNHGCFLFLRVLRCFTSPRSLHTPYTFRCG